MKAAVLGYGTVGSGVVEVILNNKEVIERKLGEVLELKYILDNREFKNDPMEALIVNDFNKILEDDEVGVIAEAMGGIEPAYTFAKAALRRGKSVATSNKELVAAHGGELLEIAKENKVSFLFEASVGGGIPIIRNLNAALTADDISSITGILNGTTNFILTKMRDEDRAFEDVLEEAQALGYAEKNPQADVEGHDACRKIAILASLAFGRTVDYKDIPTEGITNITKQDVHYAKEMGYTIKLLGTCQRENNQVSASVEPVMLPLTHPLAQVNDVFNAILVHGNMVDDVMFYGRGAGKLPTASAVVADLIEATKFKGTSIKQLWESREKIDLASKGSKQLRYFVRVEAERAYTQTLVKEIFGNIEIVTSTHDQEFVFITPLEAGAELEQELDSLNKQVKIASQICIQK